MWKFDGFVVSDLGGIRSSILKGAHITDCEEDAVARAISAGCDLDDNFYQLSLPAAVSQGLVSEKVVDQALTRVLRVAFRLGVFDPPEMVPFGRIKADVVDSAEHRQLALRTALESIVLLENRGTLLPLGRNKIKSLAVIGPQGETFETGNYYGAKPRIVSPLEGLRAKLPGAKVEAVAMRCNPRNRARSRQRRISRAGPTRPSSSSERISRSRPRGGIARTWPCRVRSSSCSKRCTRRIRRRSR